jgi:hypothetical protein
LETCTIEVEADTEIAAWQAVHALLDKENSDPHVDLDWAFMEVEDFGMPHVCYIGPHHDGAAQTTTVALNGDTPALAVVNYLNRV